MKNKAFIVYEYDQENNDLTYVKEYQKARDIQQDFGLDNIKSVYNYIVEDIEEETSYNNLLKNKYIIIKEELL